MESFFVTDSKQSRCRRCSKLAKIVKHVYVCAILCGVLSISMAAGIHPLESNRDAENFQHPNIVPTVTQDSDASGELLDEEFGGEFFGNIIHEGQEDSESVLKTTRDFEKEWRTAESPGTRPVSDVQNTEGYRTGYHDYQTDQAYPGRVSDTPQITDDDQRLRDVVTSLNSQLKISRNAHARTRSILTVIEEKQLAQERDLSFLKNIVDGMRRERQGDQETLDALRALVADNAWSVADVKQEQDRFKSDFEAFKQLQESHNDTLLQVDGLIDTNEVEHKQYHEAIRHSHQEMLYLRSSIEENRENIHHLENLISGEIEQPDPDHAREEDVDDEPGNKTPKNKSLRKNGTKEGGRGNRISQSYSVKSDEEYSGVSAANIDAIVSSLEEKDNLVEHNIKEILRNEDKMRRDMDDINDNFKAYEGEMSKIYVLFYNLSLQVSTMENKLLVQQQKRFDTDLAGLQQSFMNFTHQMFHMEQWHVSNKGALNTTTQNRAEIVAVAEALERQMTKVAILEQGFREQRIESDTSNLNNRDQIKQLNSSIRGVQKFLTDHNMKASNEFSDVDDKLIEYHMKIRENDDRLTRLEVRVLNESLNRCEKSNKDMVQDHKISEFSEKQDGIKGKIGEYGSQITRLDRGLSRVYQRSEKAEEIINNMLNQMTSVMDLIPDIGTIQGEVAKLLSQLPKDCASLLHVASDPQDGAYLLKPNKSPYSVTAWCEFSTPESGWTVIQRRTTGAVSFSRTWEEYKLGFGSPEGDYWLGNEHLHYLTRQGEYQLHLDMWDLDGQYYYASYDTFKIDEETAHYRIHIDGYQGNSTDALSYSNFMPFSTMDQDNDVSSTHCAKFYTAGWWYKHCHYGNLNGRYTVGVVWFNQDLDEWIQMSRSEMKIRPIKVNKESNANNEIEISV